MWLLSFRFFREEFNANPGPIYLSPVPNSRSRAGKCGGRSPRVKSQYREDGLARQPGGHVDHVWKKISAEEGTRTPTAFRPPAPKAGASANSATSASAGSFDYTGELDLSDS